MKHKVFLILPYILGILMLLYFVFVVLTTQAFEVRIPILIPIVVLFVTIYGIWKQRRWGYILGLVINFLAIFFSLFFLVELFGCRAEHCLAPSLNLMVVGPPALFALLTIKSLARLSRDKNK